MQMLSAAHRSGAALTCVLVGLGAAGRAWKLAFFGHFHLSVALAACPDGRLGVCDGVSGVQKMGRKLSNFSKTVMMLASRRRAPKTLGQFLQSQMQN